LVRGSSFETVAGARRGALFALAFAFILLPVRADAVVFYARDEALHLAFPQAEKVDARDFFLTAEQRGRIEDLAKTKLESDLQTVYVGSQQGKTIGYAFIDTHVVRTLPETFLIVLDPRGHVTATHVLAFYEPSEYMPGERWLRQFDDKSDPRELRIGRSIAGMTGSTLTSHAVAGAIRRALAMYDVLLKGG
jgi:hypothetical protein